MRVQGPSVMMLEIALEADAEWDSSTAGTRWSAAPPKRRSPKAPFPQLAASERPVELSVRLTGDDEVRALNAAMARQGQADQRPLLPDGAKQANCSRRNCCRTGIVARRYRLARGVCEREAADKGVPLERHATHLLVHGTLHLLGYDHHDDARSRRHGSARSARAQPASASPTLTR